MGLADGAAPKRVVSMNVCTDQLAMMLASPGQLVSVTYLARDPRTSAMAEEAAAYPANHGLAEEVFLLRPDLVIAGTFSTQTTVAMLRRLDIPVAVMNPAQSLAEVPERIAEMGRLLGREDEASALVAEFEAGLAALEADGTGRPRAAIYAAQGYTSGTQSLSGAILEAAGFANVAEEVGMTFGGLLPLEQLVMLDPDLVVLPTPRPGASRAEDVMDHPALVALREDRATSPLTDRDWVCGTPHVLRAVEGLAEARRALEGTE